MLYDSITKYWRKLKKSTKSMSAPIKLIWVGYIVFLAISYIIYIVSWSIMFYTGTAKLPELLSMIIELKSPTMIAAVIFICKFAIDNNNNGVPDTIEEDIQNSVISNTLSTQNRKL